MIIEKQVEMPTNPEEALKLIKGVLLERAIQKNEAAATRNMPSLATAPPGIDGVDDPSYKFLLQDST